jgi:hypothetical protein
MALVAALGSTRAILADDTPSRQDDVRARGAEVMPFHLADTIHVFEKTKMGGIQRVKARDGHTDEVPMIRAHLRKIADSFAQHDFSGPAHVHGEAMPGLAELRQARKDELTVSFRELDLGAELTYAGATPEIRDAIHRWFDAQLSDHGHDAMPHDQHEQVGASDPVR